MRIVTSLSTLLSAGSTYTHVGWGLLAALVLVAGGGPAAYAQTGPGGVGTTDGSSNLKLWLEPDEGVTTSSGVVEAWTDQSGYGNTADQSASTARPEFKSSLLNGKPVLRFDGSNDVLTGSSVLAGGTSGRTIYVVSKANNNTDNTKHVGLNYNNVGNKKGRVYTTTPEIAVRVAGNQTFNASQPTDAFSVLGVRNGAGEKIDAIEAFLDGQSLTSSGASSGGRTLDVQGAAFGIGAWDGLGYFSGDIAEVVVYDRELNEAERIVTENYLAAKYGLSITGDRFAYDGGHGADVAGVGQASGTTTTTAFSDVLGITNPGALADGDFLLFGHDRAGAGTWSQAETPSSDYQRLAREWRFDKTNAPGAVTLRVDAAQLPALPSGFTTYYAIVDQDGDFTTTGNQDVLPLSPASGTVYEATGVTAIDDGDRVTIAIGSPAAAPQNVTAQSDLNERIVATWDEVTTNAAGLSTTLTSPPYAVYIDSRDNGGFAFGDATALASGTDYTLSTSSGTVTAEITNDQGDDSGAGTTELENGTDYRLWITATNAVGESALSSPVTATPALKVFFESASSTGSEKNNASGIVVRLSDAQHSQDVTVDLAAAPDGQSPFDGTSLQSVSSIDAIANSGNGYAKDDIIGENDSGDGGSGLQIRVTSVDGNGGITGADLEVGGSGYTSVPASFTALSGGGSGADFTLSLQPSGADYALNPSNPRTVTISSGNDSATLGNSDLVFNDDDKPENTEVVALTLSNPSTSSDEAVTLGAQTTHDVTINDDDLDRKVYLVDNIGTADDGATSGNENTAVSYTLQLSGADPINATEVDWKIDPGAGTASTSDFTTLTGTETIAAGNTETTFTLPVDGDAAFEPDETANVTLTGARNANLDNTQSDRFTTLTHTITNDDQAPTVSFATTSSTDEEADSTVTVSVQLDQASSEDIAVSLSTGGTATGGGVDYAFSTTSITIPAGNTTATLTPDLKEDVLDENDETLTITLSSVTSGTASIGTDDTHTYTITDDDPLPAVSFANATASGREDAAGSVEVGITLSQASGRNVTVGYSTAGTAIEGTDYTDDDGGSITFSPGETSKTITLSIVADREGEPDETIDLSFGTGSVTNGEDGSTTAFTYTITNDDLGFTGPAGVGSPSTNPLWLRADSGVTESGGAVTAWADLSGNNNDATAPGGAEPTLTTNALNGEPVLNFSGGQVLTGTSVLAGGQSGRTVVLVYQPGNTKNNKILSLNYSDTGTTDGNVFTVTPEIAVRVNAGFVEYSDKLNNQYGIQTVRNGLGEDVTGVELFLDGGSVGQQKQTAQFLDVKGSDYGIGAYNGTAYFSGDIAEVMVFSGELNDAQRTIIENYLRVRYALGNNYTGTSIYGGTFTKDLFGIGAESDGTHIAGAGAGLRLSVASGFEAGDYVMAGHDVASNSVNTSDGNLPGGVAARLDRTWELDVTDAGGASTTIDARFDLSNTGLNGPAGAASNYKLLYRSTTTGTWSTIATAGSVSGDQITFSGVDVAGQDGFYTLATTDQTNSPLDNNQQSLVIEGSIGTNEADEGWRFMGLPVTGGSAGDLQKANGSGFINFGLPMAYRWDDTNGSWTQIGSDTALPPGRGFILWIYDETGFYPVDPSLTIQLPETLAPPGDVIVTVGDNTPSADEALDTGATKHLLANPYAVPFNTNALGTPGGDDFQDEVQIWEPNATAGGNDASGTDDGNVGSYVKRSRSSGESVAPWQAFWLFRSGNTQSQVAFDPAGRAPGTSVGFVGSKSNATTDVRQIDLQLVARDADSTLLAVDKAASVLFGTGATRDYDYLDTPKLAPQEPTYAVIGPVGTGREGQATIKAQESHPLPDASVEIPLALKSESVSGTFTITAPEWTQVPDRWTVTLTDTKATSDPSDDTEHQLRPNGSGYTFTYTTPKQKTSASSEASTAATDSSPRPRRLTWSPPSDPSQAGPDGTSADSEASTTKRGDRGRTSVVAKNGSATRFVLRVDPNADALPVELAGFEAQTDDQTGVLKWQTASETNNAGFYVEHQQLRAGDTTAVPGQWNELGFVEGHGTTDATQRYRYEAGPLDVGTHVFRLRQVDTDGTAHYTDAKQLSMRLRDAYRVDGPYPNPVQARATIDVAVRDEQRVRVTAFDLLGRRVKTVFRDKISSQTTRTVPVPTDDLGSGVYFLRIAGDQFATTRKMTVIE